MTEEQKNNLISKMLESPAALSDSEIMQILEDDELRDIYSISVDIKAARVNLSEIDASAEWEGFKSKLEKPRRWNIKHLYRIAAILVGALLVSAAISFMTNMETSTQEPLYAQKQRQEASQGLRASQRLRASSSRQIIANEENTERQVSPKQPRSVRKTLHTTTPQNADNPQPIDIEEYIRIEQARMENDLAMQRAEAMVNEYYAMADINEAMQSGFGGAYPMDNELITLIIP